MSTITIITTIAVAAGVVEEVVLDTMVEEVVPDIMVAARIIITTDEIG